MGCYVRHKMYLNDKTIERNLSCYRNNSQSNTLRSIWFTMKMVSW
ncbi:hypothetical protein PREVCOP_06543 [Segatella copri DSM 18205]|uniref:Uncharacterized protein n=1 Tax=Segatella copri DSM 18205 TaxID=537011 RepID=D1PH23_9BACT|nr:hypothetical protein PREVCOP_06543 [Segatella copri DSM 18205]